MVRRWLWLAITTALAPDGSKLLEALPHWLATPVATLQLNGVEEIVGFIDGGRSVVSYTPPDDGKSAALSLWDVAACGQSLKLSYKTWLLISARDDGVPAVAGILMPRQIQAAARTNLHP